MKPYLLTSVTTLCILMLSLSSLAGCASHQIAAEHGASDHAGQMDHNEMDERHAEVSELGAMVMPFDLDATTHIFEKIDSGGRHQVVVNDLNDTENLALIRSHLAEAAEKFAQGNFHAPQMIHGETMPGLHQLVMGAERLTIEYTEIPEGGQILYTTEDFDLIEAIHMWFDAQLADHGHHAQGNQ